MLIGQDHDAVYEGPHVWQLEQGQELSTLKEKLDVAQEVGVTNHLLGKGTSLDVKTLEGHIRVSESKVNFMTNCQMED